MKHILDSSLKLLYATCMPSASKNILWLSLSRVAALALLFLAYTQLYRYLGPFGTGQYQFVLSYATLFGVIVDLGISQYVVKKISSDPSSAKKYFHNFLAAEIVLAFLVYATMLGIAVARGFEPVIVYAIAVAGLGVVGAGLSSPFLAVVSAFQDLKRVALINFISSVVNFSIIVLAIIFQKHIVFLSMNTALFSVISLVLYYRFVRRHIPHPEVLQLVRSVDVRLLKKILVAALPFALLVSFSTVYNRIDVVLITKLLGFTETGFYTAAYKFMDIMNFFPAVVSHSLYPVFASAMAKGSVAAVRDILEKYVRFMIALALPMAVGGSVLARPLIKLIAGSQFENAAPVLAVLVWAIALLFMYIVANALVISQLTKYAVGITGANVLINIIGNVLLLPRIGIVGAAIMTVISEFLQGAFYFLFIRKKITKFKFFQFVWRPALASLAMGASLWVIRDWNIFFLIAFGGVVYILALFVLRFFQQHDVELIFKMLGKSHGGTEKELYLDNRV